MAGDHVTDQFEIPEGLATSTVRFGAEEGLIGMPVLSESYWSYRYGYCE